MARFAELSESESPSLLNEMDAKNIKQQLCLLVLARKRLSEAKLFTCTHIFISLTAFVF